MHVAYVHQHFATTRGTSGTRSYEMSRRLLQAGHRVTMICGAYDVSDMGRGPPHDVREVEIDGIHVVRLNVPYSNRMGFLERIRAFGSFARQATKVISKLDANLVLATSTPLSVGIPGMKGGRRLGVPFVFEVRDMWPEALIAMGFLRNPLLIWYSRRLERRIYRAAEHIIALSPGIKDGVCRTGYPAERITLIPNAADLDLFRPSSDKLDDDRFGPADDFRLVFTGAHGRMNGLDAVLDAAAELKRRGVTGVRFVFIGQGGEKPHLMERGRAEGLDGVLSWVDPIPKEELARVLPRMDVGLMILRNHPALYYNTSPNKFFDYIASGLPVLNNYPGWLAEMITAHRCGVAVEPDNPEAFADAVLDLRDRPTELKEMGGRGRRLAESHFARDDLADRFVATLEEAHRRFRRH